MVKKKSKSTSSSRRRERSRSPPRDGKTSKRRAKPRSKSPKKVEKKEECKTASRKTRWQAADAADSSKNVSTPVAEAKPEKSDHPQRIKDFLHDKGKIVDLLFQTVTGSALQELTPDYLKKRSNEELKKLCLEQIKTTSDEVILKIISGKVTSSNNVEEEKVEKEKNFKTEEPDVPKEKGNVDVQVPTKKPKPGEVSNPASRENSSSDVLELHTTTTEMESILDEENQIPLVIKDEVAKDLILPERDAELLELEMRARAIRALLKAKSQSGQEDSETPSKEGD